MQHYTVEQTWEKTASCAAAEMKGISRTGKELSHILFTFSVEVLMKISMPLT